MVRLNMHWPPITPQPPLHPPFEPKVCSSSNKYIGHPADGTSFELTRFQLCDCTGITHSDLWNYSSALLHFLLAAFFVVGCVVMCALPGSGLANRAHKQWSSSGVEFSKWWLSKSFDFNIEFVWKFYKGIIIKSIRGTSLDYILRISPAALNPCRLLYILLDSCTPANTHGSRVEIKRIWCGGGGAAAAEATCFRVRNWIFKIDRNSIGCATFRTCDPHSPSVHPVQPSSGSPRFIYWSTMLARNKLRPLFPSLYFAKLQFNVSMGSRSWV